MNTYLKPEAAVVEAWESQQACCPIHGFGLSKLMLNYIPIMHPSFVGSGEMVNPSLQVPATQRHAASAVREVSKLLHVECQFWGLGKRKWNSGNSYTSSNSHSSRSSHSYGGHGGLLALAAAVIMDALPVATVVATA